MVDRFMDFLLLAVVDNSFMLGQPFVMMLVETTFMFSLHLCNFFVLSLYINNFLLSHIQMTVLVVFEQLNIFLAIFEPLFVESCLNDDGSCV